VLWAYASATSCAPGERLGFRVGNSEGGVPSGSVAVSDAVSGRPLLDAAISGQDWTLCVPEDCPSSLYRAAFTPGEGPDAEVYFVVRGSGHAVLISVPFATWQAYNRAGVPGEGLYWTEDPSRAARVSFDRPGGGPPPERWEDGLMRWLRGSGFSVDYCSDLDLHLRPELLRDYRLLVVNGHSEYWTWEMRDTVEGFTRRGGNLAVFGGNTCWWQMRLEDNGRTMVCYRDAVADPCPSPELSTVEWSSSPVCRPENSMIGLSFRLGAGCWGPGMASMYEDSYSVRFADHWVFEGTGLTDGDKFAQGALGYETDAADIVEVDGVPRATGRDGTPSSFTVLATADLSHWRQHGQGGSATMGVFESGAGTVFNAGTVNWGAELGDPVVARVTRNVIDRLSSSAPSGWTVLGTRDGVRALAVSGASLVAVLEDGSLATRELCSQNLPWRRIGSARDVVAIAVPREAVVGGPLVVYAATSAGALLRDWVADGGCPARTVSLAACDGRLFALDTSGVVWVAGQGSPREWVLFDEGSDLRALAAMNGRLFAVDSADGVLSKRAIADDEWAMLASADGVEVFTACAGRLIGSGGGRPLRALVP
jgi:hypothetical protein